jgi:hypothetical protein
VNRATTPKGPAGVAFLALVALCVSLLLVVFVAPAAQAAHLPYKLSHTFGQGDISNAAIAAGIAVDNSATATRGSVYVADASGGVVRKYNAAGESADFSALAGSTLTTLAQPAGVAVDPTSGDIYVAESKPGGPTLSRFNSAGEPVAFIAFQPQVSGNQLTGTPNGAAVTPFKSLGALAVDPNNGDIYLVDTTNALGAAVVDKFSPTGEFLLSFNGEPGHPLLIPRGLAVDSIGDVYVTNFRGYTDKFDSSGNYVSTLAAAGPPNGVAIDPSTGEIYVNLLEPSEVEVYNSTGTEVVNSFPVGEGATAVALSAETHDLYALYYEHGAIYSEPARQTLTVEPVGTGSGTVTSSPVGIDCGVECSAEYEEGRKVTLSQSAAAGSFFAGWSGCDSEIEGKCEVTMSTAKTVKADFSAGVTLTVTKEGSGEGIVTSSPAGIDCGGACSASYTPGETVILTETPGSTSAFSGWSGCDSEPAGKCEVTLSAAKQVKASFSAIPQETLTVTKSGKGTVLSIPAGIDCGASCAHAFNQGTTVTLSAEAATHYAFAGWSGACSGTSVCEVTMSEAKTVGASFAGPEPSIDGESSIKVGYTSATLSAQINPNGAPAAFRVQYGPSASYGNETKEVEIGGGESDRTAEAQLTGLSPDTTYHYRFLAVNPAAAITIEGADRTFTTFSLAAASFPLPDHRAYELVSPVAKNGGSIDGGTFIFDQVPEQAAAQGDAVTYGSSTAFAGAQSVLLNTQYLSRRTAGGWSTEGIEPPIDPSTLPNGHVLNDEGAVDVSPYQGFSEDLSQGFLQSGDPAPVPASTAGYSPGYWMPYLHDLNTRGFQLLADQTPSVQPPGVFDSHIPGLITQFAGSTPDGRHVVFAANDALAAGAVPGQKNLYEWSEGQLHLVNVLPGPGESPDAGASFGPPSNIFPLDDGQGPGETLNFSHVISADGSRIFWTGTDGNIYVRENATTTKLVGSGYYWTASADGSKVFFTAGSPKAGSGDLYQYDLDTEQTTDLTPGTHVAGVIGASDDGSYVYYATGSGPGAEAEVYVVHNGASTLIARVKSSDSHDWALANIERTARVAPNGRYLAFQSESSLTGYDNTSVALGDCTRHDSSSGQYIPVPLCTEVFVYDAVSEKLSCASCNPSGARPTGDSLLPTPEPDGLAGAIDRGWVTPAYQQRYLLDNGELFFDSNDAILPRDINGKMDVYEYEPASAGACGGEGQNGGCLSLVSTGSSVQESRFFDASASGRDVFFTTTQQLVLIDADNLRDLYDAREGGGIAAQNEPPPVQCQGEACQAPPSLLNDATPASAGFSGPGNQTSNVSPPAKPKTGTRARSRKCKKPRTLKHGQCVKAKKGKKADRRAGKGRR